MSVPSFERFDYQLRSNKHIERKLIFDLLVRARRSFDLSKYAYVGLGSLWFADHRLAHRLLNIDRLISLEAAENADRAIFNKPYGSIEVQAGLSHEILPTWTDENWLSKKIAWMDYDGNLDTDVVSDLALLAQRLAINSVVLITVNANFQNYRIKQNAVEAAAKRNIIVDPRAIATLAQLLGDVVPAAYLNKMEAGKIKPVDVKEKDFAAVLAECLLAFISHKITVSGRQDRGQLLRFVPLFNFCHKDGVEMVTVGGAITSADDLGKWQTVLTDDPLLESENGMPTHQRLDLIPITLKEKLILDSILPTNDADFDTKTAESGLRIGAEQAQKYRRHYRHFPTFVETPI
jgi:hypothetical protein